MNLFIKSENIKDVLECLFGANYGAFVVGTGDRETVYVDDKFQRLSDLYASESKDVVQLKRIFGENNYSFGLAENGDIVDVVGEKFDFNFDVPFLNSFSEFVEKDGFVITTDSDGKQYKLYLDGNKFGVADYLPEQVQSDRVICDYYSKDEKTTWDLEPDKPENAAFNKKIVAVNNVYGWLYEQGLLEKHAIEFKDYTDVTYFAVDVNDLKPYREAMERSGVLDADIAVKHIFDEEYTPCLYSGTIQLGWTMRTYRDIDGTVGSSWECGLIKHLNSDGIFEVEDVKNTAGVKEAVHKMFELSEFIPSDITKTQNNGMVMSDEALVNSLTETYKDRWTPDTSDTLFEEISAIYGPEIAGFSVKSLEDEYKSWFDMPDTVDELIEDAEIESEMFSSEVYTEDEKEFVPF